MKCNVRRECVRVEKLKEKHVKPRCPLFVHSTSTTITGLKKEKIGKNRKS